MVIITCFFFFTQCIKVTNYLQNEIILPYVASDRGWESSPALSGLFLSAS